MSNSILLTPGPVQLHPEVEKILGLPMIHHRTPQFDEILNSCLKNLKKIFCTTQPVFALTSTGTGGMECLLINTLNKDDQVLAIISGKFGERWATMAESFGGQVLRHNVPWGESVNPKDIESILNKNPEIKIVLCQACETSTATSHPIEELSKIISKTSALFLVDAITALGAYPIMMDEWKIDGLVGGSQKAFMLPTGMSFVSFSEKAWVQIKKNKNTKFYFNIENEYAANKKGETLFSSNVTILRALDFVLKDILKKGLDKHFQEIKNRALYTQRISSDLGLTLYSKSPSTSVTALKLPTTIDGVKFRDQLEKKYSLIVMGGQDHLKGQILRLGHMGYIPTNQLHESTLKLAALLNENGFNFNLEAIENKSKDYIKEIFTCQ